MNEFTFLYTEFTPDFNDISIVSLDKKDFHHGIYHTKDIMNIVLADNKMYYTFVFTDWRDLEKWHMQHGTLFVYIEKLIDEFKIQLRNINISNILD